MNKDNETKKLLSDLIRQVTENINLGNFHEAWQILTEPDFTKMQIPNYHFLKGYCALVTGRFSEVLPNLNLELEYYPNCEGANKLIDAITQEGRANITLRAPFTPHRTFVICGLPPYGSGTGMFLHALQPYAEKHLFRILHPDKKASFTDFERVLISQIQDSNLVVLHPQYLGYSLFFDLLSNRNKISLFVLDNGFFCIQSYNYRKEKNTACLDCLGNLDNCSESCQPFPCPYPKEENLYFLKTLLSVSPYIKFICQTQTQKELVIRHFGKVNVTVSGLKTDEFTESESHEYDIVLHASAHPAKGVIYMTQLAHYLPEMKILMPFTRENLSSLLDDELIPANITFENITWNSGLKQRVMNCRLVVCPSLWSAPVEGALMKSLYYNGNVAVYDAPFSFQNEFPDDLVLRLNSDLNYSASIIRNFINDGKSRYDLARKWVERYHESVNLEALFD